MISTILFPIMAIWYERISNVPIWMKVMTMFIVFILSLILYITWSWPKPRDAKFQRADHFHPDRIPTKNIDTIVIGSGIGGSTCANILAQSGQVVLVLEQHTSVTGGCTHSFREQGCEWDTGLHYVGKAICYPTTRPGALMNFMSRGLQQFTPLPDHEPYDEVVFPVTSPTSVKVDAPNNSSYCFYDGTTRTIDSIVNQIASPHEAATLRKRLTTWMSICTDINEGFVALGLMHLFPHYLRFLFQKKVQELMTYASYTVRNVQHAVFALGYEKEDLLKYCPSAPDIDTDPSILRMKAVMAHPIGDYAVQPREATMAAAGITMAHYNNGAAYTVGPTQNISIRLTSMVRSYGGEVLLDATVRKIIIQNGKAIGVEVCNTSALQACVTDHVDYETVPTYKIYARNIVCATSVYNLYSKLLPSDMPIVQKFHNPLYRSIRPSNGHIFLFCKIKGDADTLNIPKHNLWYFNGYDLDTAFDQYFANPTKVRPPTVYIGFPCTKDVTWNKRFPGISNCILISDGLYEWFTQWSHTNVRHRGKDYIDFKDQLTKHLLDILYETVPQVKDKVEFYHLGTPLTEVSYLASYRAGSYGTQCNTNMFASINHEWTTTPHTSIPNLYVAGSDAFLPAVTGAMYGGAFGACAVLGHIGTLRFSYTMVSHVAKHMREANPKLTWYQAYREAVKSLFLST